MVSMKTYITHVLLVRYVELLPGIELGIVDLGRVLIENMFSSSLFSYL
jgi:hypothetical protein